MGWVVLACELLLVVVLYRSSNILFFYLFCAFMAANALAAPLYITGHFVAWYWFQIPVNMLLLLASWEAFDVHSAMIDLLPDPNVPRERQLVYWSSVWFGVVLVLLSATHKMQYNVPPILLRLRLFPVVLATGFLFEVWVYFLMQPPGRYHPKASAHTCVLFAYNALTTISVMIPITKGQGHKWEIVQVTQQAIRVGLLLVWINLFWTIRPAAETRPQGNLGAL